MSGGSLDYAYFKVEDAASQLRKISNNPLHRAFAVHLEKVAKALHDVEWVLSSDYSEGREEEAIKEVLGDNVDLKILEVLSEDVKNLAEEIKKLKIK